MKIHSTMGYSMASISTEDTWLASILYNRAHNAKFRSGGKTMNDQAANAAGNGAGVGALINGSVAYTNGINSAIGSAACMNLQDAYAAVSAVSNGGPVEGNVKILYNWGTSPTSGNGPPPPCYLNGTCGPPGVKYFIAQINDTMFFGLQSPVVYPFPPRP
jgi:hypothetical protein